MTAFALLAVAAAVFALGECLHGAVQAPLVVDLADPQLLGRYMALSALSWQVGFTSGRPSAASCSRRSPTGLWIVLAVRALVAGGVHARARARAPDALRRVPLGARAQELVAVRSRRAPEPDAGAG